MEQKSPVEMTPQERTLAIMAIQSRFQNNEEVSDEDIRYSILLIRANRKTAAESKSKKAAPVAASLSDF